MSFGRNAKTMCEACQTINEAPVNKRMIINNILQFDPTRTLTLRKAFVADMDRRFNALKRLIKTSIVDNDCFGLVETTTPFSALAAATQGQFRFDRSAAKVEGFMTWLQEQEKAGVLELVQKSRIGAPVETLWVNTYIDTAYQRGIRRGREELRKQGVDIPTFGDKQLRDPVIAAFNQPIHADRVGMIYSRVYSDLKGVTSAMDTQISRVLAQGLAEGRNPRELARVIADRVDAIGITRARTLARTEVIRAHHAANVQEYRNAGIEGVSVMAEWSTAGFRVCPVCSALQGKRFTLDEIEFEIPKHPNCVAGDSVVLAPDALVLMETKYSGPVIKVLMADGARLTVTPNHMLLTPHGLVMARFLHDGDDLLYCPSAQGEFIGGPDDNRNPACINEVVKAFAEPLSGSSCSVPLTPVDFHGDGAFCEGDVNIVRADGFLCDGINTKMGEMFQGFQFNGRSIFDVLFADGTFTEFFKGAFLPPDSCVGFSREELAFLRGSLLHPQKHGLTPVPGNDIQFFEAAGDNTPIHPKPFRHGFDRQAIIDHFQDCFGRDLMPVAGASFSEGQTRLGEVSLKGVAFTSTNEGCQPVEGFASHVTRMQIKDVEIAHVESLPMFDVTTMSTGYIVNGILSSNCRCVAIPIVA